MIVDKPHGRTPRKHADPKIPDGIALGVAGLLLAGWLTLCVVGAAIGF